MDKLDRQSWVAGLSMNAYGLCIGIRANSQRALTAVIAVLPPGLKPRNEPEVDVLYSVVAGRDEPSSGMRRYNLAYANIKQLARSTNFDKVPTAVESHLSLYIAEFAKSRLFIHAGVVGWKGKAVLIPGTSYAGKSTLVRALLEAGATYYSDEFALVDRLGRIHPYPSPIHQRNGDGTVRKIQPADLRGRLGRRPLPVGLVLLTRHLNGATWQPRRISAGEGMLGVLTNTVSAQRDPRRALRTLTRMLRGVAVLEGARGEAKATVDSLLRSGYLASE